MRLYGYQNKYEVLQDFYLDEKGIEISYTEALDLFNKLEGTDKTNFEIYYKDQVGYEIIYTAGKGFNLDPGVGIDSSTTNTKIVKRKRKQLDASGNPTGKAAKDANGNVIYDDVVIRDFASTSNIGRFTKSLIRIKYTLDAYAKSNGLTLDPVWSQYTYEEILEMEATGVNIPQDVLDIAHTMQEQNAQEIEVVEGEVEEEETVEKEPYLELIPKAQKKIKKTKENGQKINDAIEDLLPEQQKQEKNILSKMKKQRRSLEEYEAFVREWRALQNKVNSGEELSESESRRYARLTGMMSGVDRTEDLKIDKREIARSLNQINILATLGENLAAETIEVGEELADYTCKSNFKATRKTVAMEVGFIASIMAMAKGKNLSKEALVVGHMAEDYTEETRKSVNDIAGLLEIEGSIADLGSAAPEQPEQPADVPQSDAEKSEANEKVGEAQEEQKVEEVEGETKVEDQEATDIEPSQAPAEEGQTENSDAEENKDFIITDENVQQLIKEAGIINSDLVKQIMLALRDAKTAKKDSAFAKFAGKRVQRLLNEYKKQELKRQQEIQTKEEENEESYKEIEKLTGQSKEDVEDEMKNEKTSGKDDKDDWARRFGINANKEESTEEKVKRCKENISDNNDEIEEIHQDSEKAKEQFKNDTKREKNIVDKRVPEENDALKYHSEYESELIPEDQEKLDFTSATGTSLRRMGKAVVEMGGIEIIAAYGLMFFAPFAAKLLLSKGIYDIARGARSMKIGKTAHKEGSKPYKNIAEKATEVAVNNITDAVNNLNELDNKIVSVTGEDSAQSQYDAANGTEENQTEEQQQAPVEGTTEGTSETENQNSTEQQQETIDQAADAMNNVNVQASVSDLSQSTQAGENSNAASQRSMASNAMSIGNKDNEKEETKTSSTGSSKKSKKSSKKEDQPEVPKNVSKEEGKRQAKSGRGETQDIKKGTQETKQEAKESQKIDKDEQKTEKQLRKEAKQLQKNIEKEQKAIEKYEKETARLEQRQMELAAQFEALDAQNEQLTAEAEAAAQQQQNSQQGAQQGVQGAMATTAFQMQPGGGQNQEVSEKVAQITANNTQITAMGTEYTLNNQKISRNQEKIKISTKYIKKTSKAFTKKVKKADKKAKAEQKAEEEKQKKLQKKLAAVAVAESVFNLVSTVGVACVTIGTALAAMPWTAAAGAIMINIGNICKQVGLAGTIACGISKATILIANGNLQAGLMSIGLTIVSAASSLAGGQQATGSALQIATASLQTVQAAANVGNAVREFKGKEPSNLLSGISAVAGIGSAVTGAASSLGNMGKEGASVLGKIGTVASTAGSTLSASAEMINTSRQLAGKEGDNKVANILSMAGMGLSTAGSVASLADSAANGIKNKKASKDARKTSNKVKEVGKMDAAGIPQAASTTDISKAAPEALEIKGFTPTTGTAQKPATDTTNVDIISNGGGGLFETTSVSADAKDVLKGLPKGGGKIGNAMGDSSNGGMYSSTSHTERDASVESKVKEVGKMEAAGIPQAANTPNIAAAKPEPIKVQGVEVPQNNKTNNSKFDTVQKIMQGVGSATSLVMSLLPQEQQAQVEQKKKTAPAGKLTKRMKQIMKKTAAMKRRRVMKKSSAAKYYAR